MTTEMLVATSNEDLHVNKTTFMIYHFSLVTHIYL